MYFKLLPGVGGHAETVVDEKGKSKVVNHLAAEGYVFDTEDDLCSMFPNKFTKVMDPDAVVIPSKSTKTSKKAKKGKKGKKDDEPNPLGRDVTKSFKGASKEDFMVFADGGAYFVVEAEAPTVALNIDKPLHKKQVLPFIKEFLDK